LIDRATGTLAVRAILPNHEQVLVPGYFVRVRVGAADEHDSLLVPDAALGTDQGGRYLLVLDKDNTVEQRKVTIGPKVGDLRVIESGLKPGSRRRCRYSARHPRSEGRPEARDCGRDAGRRRWREIAAAHDF
jgi:multidrug efflux pump subunit AcrA (membrane-fusion protein)